MFINIPFIILVIIYIVFILLNKNKGIIKDIGIFKITLFSIGIIFYFFSNIFTSYMNHKHCLINFIFKHTGLSLVLIIYYIINSLCIELGIEFNKEDEKEFDMVKTTTNFIKSEYTESRIQHPIVKSSTMNSFKNSLMPNINDYFMDDDQYKNFSSKLNQDMINKPNYIENLIVLKIINKKKENQIFNMGSIRSSIIRMITIDKSGSKQSSIDRKEIEDNDQNKYIVKSIKNAHSSFVRAFLFYIFYSLLILITSIVSIIYNKNINEPNYDYYLVQNSNGLWTYTCNLESTDLVFNVIDFFILLVVLIKGKNIIYYKLIFKCTQYITYSSLIAIILGPLTNVIKNFYYFYSFLNKIKKKKIFKKILTLFVLLYI